MIDHFFFGSLLNQFWSKLCDTGLVRKPRCYSFLHKQFMLADYVRRSHQSDLSKTSKHWDIFLSHCKYWWTLFEPRGDESTKSIKMNYSLKKLRINMLGIGPFEKGLVLIAASRRVDAIYIEVQVAGSSRTAWSCVSNMEFSGGWFRLENTGSNIDAVWKTLGVETSPPKADMATEGTVDARVDIEGCEVKLDKLFLGVRSDWHVWHCMAIIKWLWMALS